MDERLLDPDPIAQVASWYAQAQERGVAQPEAMTLATATPAGAPSARMVLLKGIDARGLIFFTNLDSRKAAELAANPRAALVLYWQPLRRQVRVEGRVERLSEAESAAYFATRPRGGALAAWASPQSRPLESRDALERLYAGVEQRFAGEDVPLPPFWGGYLVVPDAVELWEGRDNRLHDRVRYERAGSAWRLTRLAP